MDSVTQAVLGAAIGEAVLGKKIGNKAALLGAIGGTIPDLDILLNPFFSTLQNISIHRGYSHSILFCLLGGLFFAWLLTKVKWTKEISYTRLFSLSFLALFTHILLDAFTTYGTQLFLPFSDYRVSFDSVNIVDPLYTLPLLALLLITLFKARSNGLIRSKANSYGLILSSAYLIFTLGNKERVENIFQNALDERGIQIEYLSSVPVKVANIYWYGVARSSDSLYLAKYSPFQKDDLKFDVFPVNEQLLDDLDPYLIDRLKWFAQDNFIVAESEGKIRMYNMQCDMQGVRTYGSYRAPTAFYYEIKPHEDGSYDLKAGMHDRK